MRGHPLTPEQIEAILTSYKEKGFVLTKRLAISFGVHPRYISRLARAKGFRNNHWRGFERAQVPKSAPQDKRWQWAIERGSVTV